MSYRSKKTMLNVNNKVSQEGRPPPNGSIVGASGPQTTQSLKASSIEALKDKIHVESQPVMISSTSTPPNKPPIGATAQFKKPIFIPSLHRTTVSNSSQPPRNSFPRIPAIPTHKASKSPIPNNSSLQPTSDSQPSIRTSMKHGIPTSQSNETIRSPIGSVSSKSPTQPMVDSTLKDGCRKSSNGANVDSSIDVSVQGEVVTSKVSKTHVEQSSKRSKEWPENIEFDENDEVMTVDAKGKYQALKRSVQPRDVMNQQEVKYCVEFNEFNQPLRRGGSILVRFLGYLAKNERFCPIGEKDWHHVSKKYKADIMECVRSKFDIPHTQVINKLALTRVGKTWRNYRYTLRNDYFKPQERTREQIYNDIPRGHASDQWVRLVDYWYSPNFKKLSDNGREARGSLTHVHTTGSTSYANMRANFIKEEGREPSHLEFFLKTHTKKDGGFVDGTISQQLLDDASSKVKERCVDSSSIESKIQIENEVFNALMFEDEEPKRPIGFGFGVNKSAIFGVQGELKKRGYDCSISGNFMHVEGAIAKVAKSNKEVEEQNKHLQKENKVLKSQVHEHNQVLMQILNAMQTGQVSNDFIKTTKSALQRCLEVEDLTNVDNVENGSGDAHIQGSPS